MLLFWGAESGVFFNGLCVSRRLPAKAALPAAMSRRPQAAGRGPPPHGGRRRAAAGGLSPAPHVGAGGEASRHRRCRFPSPSCLFPRRRRRRSGLDRNARPPRWWGRSAAGLRRAWGGRREGGESRVGRSAGWRFPAPREPGRRGGGLAAGLAVVGPGSGWFRRQSALSRFLAVGPRCPFSPISPAGQLTVGLSVLSLCWTGSLHRLGYASGNPG